MSVTITLPPPLQGPNGEFYYCGASIISPKYLASAAHCFYNLEDPEIDFDRDCKTPGICIATVREHDIFETEAGEKDITILAIHRPQGLWAPEGDLAIVELQEAVKLDEKAQIVKVANETLKVGDAVTALGWGIPFQPRAGLPEKLLSVRLNVSKVYAREGLTYTAVGKTKQGIPVDTCAGDSGGPLLAWREDAWRLYATLQGGGYNCETDRTVGDGVWNSLAKYNDWIQDFLDVLDLDCGVSSWSLWSQCSLSCGGGSRGRRREIISRPQGAGAGCPNLNDTQECNTGICPGI